MGVFCYVLYFTDRRRKMKETMVSKKYTVISEAILKISAGNIIPSRKRFLSERYHATRRV